MNWWRKPVALAALLGSAAGHIGAQTVSEPPVTGDGQKSPISQTSAQKKARDGFLFFTQQSNGGVFGIVAAPVGNATAQVKGFMNPARGGEDGKNLDREYMVIPSVRFPVGDRFSVGPAVAFYKLDDKPFVIQTGVQATGKIGPIKTSAAAFMKTADKSAGLLNFGVIAPLGKSGKHGFESNLAMTPSKVAFWDAYYTRKVGHSGRLRWVVGCGKLPLRNQTFFETGFEANIKMPRGMGGK